MTVIPLLVCAFAVTLIIGLADGAEAGLEKPSGHGPYEVGFINATYPMEDSEYDANVTVYYPATLCGKDAPPDTTDAPYPTVLWYWSYELNLTYLDEVIDTVTSHGFVMAINYVELHPLILTFGDELPFEYHSNAWTTMVNRVEYLDADPSSALYGMVDREAYGISGHGSSTWGTLLGTEDGRYDAFAYLAGAWLEDYPEVTVPSHWQPAEDTLDVIDVDRFGMFFQGWDYRLAKNERSEIKVKGSQFFEGGYDLGAFVAFFLVYLDGKDEYRTFLYGEEAIKDVASGHSDLKFDAGGGDVFPPVEHKIDGPEGPVLMDFDVRLVLNITGHPIHQYPEFQVDWFVDGELGVITDKGQDVSRKFTEPGNYKFAARWYLGDIEFYYNWTLPVFVDVINMPPVAIAGPTDVFDHDSEVVFDASESWDTASHDEFLEFKWSFPDGKETEFSNDPTYRKTLTLLGQYVVTLTVRDPLGETSTAQCVLTVNNVVPTVKALVKADANEDEILSFTGEGTDTPSHIDLLEYQWDFADGSNTDWMDVPYIDHTYVKCGTCEATLWVRDPAGEMTNATVRITVENVAPDGGIEKPKDGDSKYTGSRLEFEGWGTDTASDIGSLRYYWDFGDGSTAEGPYALHKYSDDDDYTVTLTIEDDDGAMKIVTHDLKIEKELVVPIDDPIFVIVAFGLVTIMVMVAMARTEPGLYWFGLVGAPLFVKTKDVMDNKTRHALLGVIVTNPGVHYSALREEFGLANGAAAYHLSVLERENFIKSARDGNMKRFYAATARVPSSDFLSPEDMREELKRIITARPGITQRELIEEVGYSRDSVGYHLREMVKEGCISCSRKGKFATYHPNNDK